MNTETDVVTLLNKIRSVGNKLLVSANVYDALDKAKEKYFTYFQ